MAASKKRKERRALERAQRAAAIIPPDVMEAVHASAPPILRLVRSEGAFIPVESASAGRASENIAAVPEEKRSDGMVGSPQGDGAVVTTIADRPAERSILVDSIPPNLVRRSFDADEINPFLNDPSVYKYAAYEGMGEFDLAPLLADTRNVLLMADHGGMIFHWQALGVYQVHTNFLKAQRHYSGPGTYVLNACRAAYRWMFTNTDCVTLLTLIPAHNRAASMFAPLAGWTKEFERKNVWPSVEDGLVDMSFLALRYDDWVRKTPELMLAGRAFHNQLEREFERHGAQDKKHPDEDCHDLHVGACFEMIRGGQLDKAVILYNRWAQFAGYGQIEIVSHNPAVLNIGTALIQIYGDTFKVVKVL
jgi:hypothetical protein